MSAVKVILNLETARKEYVIPAHTVPYLLTLQDMVEDLPEEFLSETGIDLPESHVTPYALEKIIEYFDAVKTGVISVEWKKKFYDEIEECGKINKDGPVHKYGYHTFEQISRATNYLNITSERELAEKEIIVEKDVEQPKSFLKELCKEIAQRIVEKVIEQEENPIPTLREIFNQPKDGGFTDKEKIEIFVNEPWCLKENEKLTKWFMGSDELYKQAQKALETSKNAGYYDPELESSDEESSDDDIDFDDLSDDDTDFEDYNDRDYFDGYMSDDYDSDEYNDEDETEAKKWIEENKNEEYIVDKAASEGNMKVLRHLYKNNMGKCTTEAMDSAATNGHLSVVWFLKNKFNAACTNKAIEGAAKNKHDPIIEMMITEKLAVCTPIALEESTKQGNLDAVIFLTKYTNVRSTNNDDENSYVACSEEALDEAAINGHLEVVRYFHKKRRERCTQKGIDGAAENGKIETVYYLHTQQNNVCTAEGLNGAAKNGHTEIVKYIYTKMGVTSNDAIVNAATAGKLDTVKHIYRYISKENVKKAIFNAVENGYLDVVKYLYRHIKDEDERRQCLDAVIEKANTTNNFTIFRWAIDRKNGVSKNKMDVDTFAE